MKLSNKIIQEVVAYVAGEEAVSLAQILKNKKNVSEFKLADSIDRGVNETRNLLYKLYHSNLVTFTRRKDKKKGWYVYFWTFKLKQVKHLLSRIKTEKLTKLRERLAREQDGFFFICSNKCIRLDFDQAIAFKFKCPECGIIMDQQDNAEQISRVQKEIKEIEKAIK